MLPAEPEPAPEPPAKPPEPLVAFDPTTATTLRAKIVALPNRKDWVGCGYIHSIGALEVEVLDVGEPRPKLILLVSCPADLGSGGKLLAVDGIIEVTLHERKPSWPRVRGLAPELPIRHVASFVGVLPL